MRPVRNGSSPYVSCPRPHRGSRKILIFGDQTVNPLYCTVDPSGPLPTLYFARNSVAIACASRWSNASSNVAANPIACGNTVATPARATPCSPSFHQLYSGTPSRGIPSAVCPNCETFSSKVIAWTNKPARSSKLFDVSNQGLSAPAAAPCAPALIPTPTQTAATKADPTLRNANKDWRKIITSQPRTRSPLLHHETKRTYKAGRQCKPSLLQSATTSARIHGANTCPPKMFDD